METNYRFFFSLRTQKLKIIHRLLLCQKFSQFQKEAQIIPESVENKLLLTMILALNEKTESDAECSYSSS